jgi:pyruvate/2-oxoacid:ferredoxin oxidoreductase beta subunit
MTVGELVEILAKLDQGKRVVVADTDGAGAAEDIEFVDQRVEKGENVITVWYHK